MRPGTEYVYILICYQINHNNARYKNVYLKVSQRYSYAELVYFVVSMIHK